MVFLGFYQENGGFPRILPGVFSCLGVFFRLGSRSGRLPKRFAQAAGAAPAGALYAALALGGGEERGGRWVLLKGLVPIILSFFCCEFCFFL